MLQLSTIDTTTLELLKKLMCFDEFKKMRLVGGTALALQIGHRKSIDLDFFGSIDFQSIYTAKTFANFNKIVILKSSKNINIFSIDDIKVDFVDYNYPWLQNEIKTDGIRLAHVEDIAAMKLAAVTGRGSRKDFIDIYFLLHQYDLKEMINFYNKKYYDGSEYMVLKSLTYFDDAEKDFEIQMIQKISWTNIKNYILNAVALYNKDL
jgi:predicted nucleotidyltransferase component of viral defense system